MTPHLEEDKVKSKLIRKGRKGSSDQAKGREEEETIEQENANMFFLDQGTRVSSTKAKRMLGRFRA